MGLSAPETPQTPLGHTRWGTPVVGLLADSKPGGAKTELRNEIKTMRADELT